MIHATFAMREPVCVDRLGGGPLASPRELDDRVVYISVIKARDSFAAEVVRIEILELDA